MIFSKDDRAAHYIFDVSRLKKRTRDRNEAEIRALCSTAFLGQDTALSRVLGRYKMFVDTSDVGLSSHLMIDGYWEMWVTEAIADLVRPGMVVADVGANLGYFTLLMADLVGPAGRVHAFEPNPRMAERLAKSIDVNGFGDRAHLHQVALGERDGEPMAFFVPPHEPKNAYMLKLEGEPPPGAAVLHTARLDSREDWCAIEFAKIDVEGAEELLWTGAQGLFASPVLRSVILEFTPGRYADAALFLDRVLSPGFSLSVIDPFHGIVECSAADILGGNPVEDVMLLLRR